MKPMMDTIAEICAYSPRQAEGETRTAEYIIRQLEAGGHPITIEEYDAVVPIVQDARLRVESTTYTSPDVEGCCHESGKIGDRISFEEDSSRFSAGLSGFTSVIANNPRCTAPSLAQFYPLPAIATTREIYDAAQRVYWDGGPVDGHVTLEEQSHKGKNILVGDTASPQVLCITHYDSLLKGALDNASSVAVALRLLEQRREFKHVLFAICGTEEHGSQGYRAFYGAHEDAFLDTDKIVVIDSVGNSRPQLLDGAPDVITSAGLPFLTRNELAYKFHLVIGDIPDLFTVYHSNDDDGRNLTEKRLEQSLTMLAEQLSSID